VLVTELTRWGRNTLDLIETLQQLAAWNVSGIAQTGMEFSVRNNTAKTGLQDPFAIDVEGHRTASDFSFLRGLQLAVEM
jgi:hypothetical protein